MVVDGVVQKFFTDVSVGDRAMTAAALDTNSGAENAAGSQRSRSFGADPRPLA